MSEKITISLKDETLHILPKESPNLTDTAVNAINTLLLKEGIEKILYIDDKFDIEAQKAFFLGMLKQIKNEGEYPSDDNFNETINWQLPLAAFNKEILTIWEEAKDKKKLIHNVSNLIGDNESSNITPALEFKDYFPGDNALLLTPNEWIERKKEILDAIPEGRKVLCLFDFELENFTGPNNEKNGIELIKELIESGYSEKVICGIFSHKYTEEEEDTFRKEYRKEFDLPKKFFCTISKSRFAHDPKLSGFAEGIKYILITRYIEDLKSKSIKILKESNNKSIKDFKKISPKTFNQIIQKSSYKEGVWEVESLFRLNTILNSDANLSSLLDEDVRKNFDGSVLSVRGIDSVETGYSRRKKSPESLNIREKELYINQEYLNNLNLPIANGDIFVIGSKKYILAVQPCNLALRSNGTRTRSYNKGILIPLIDIDTKRFNSSTSYKLYRTDSHDNILCALFSEYQNINLDILDLTVFNTESSAIMDMKINNVDSNNVIQESWKKRYKGIHKNFKNEEKIYLAYNTIKQKLDGKFTSEFSLLNSFFDNPLSIKQFKLQDVEVYDYENRIFDFQLKRIKRYKEPYSTDLLHNFMSYLSRNGFDIDFTS